MQVALQQNNQGEQTSPGSLHRMLHSFVAASYRCLRRPKLPAAAEALAPAALPQAEGHFHNGLGPLQPSGLLLGRRQSYWSPVQHGT